MKKIKYLMFGLCVFIIQHNIIIAQQQVSIDEIKKVAVQSSRISPINSRSLAVDEVNVKRVNTLKNERGNTLMYETVLDDGQRILLSGSKACLPVLGYMSLPEGKSIFDDDMPDGLKFLLEEYQEQLELCFQNDTIRLHYQAEWQEMLQEETNISQKRNVKTMSIIPPEYIAVAPLLTSRWGQDKPNILSWADPVCDAYNYYAPYTGGICKECRLKCAAGCVAVAMAQIMYFWKYPVYTIAHGTAYDWCNMVDALNADPSNHNYINERNAVARLIRDCGDALGMKDGDYTCEASSAKSKNARDALVNRFNYSNDADYQRKFSYSESNWKNKIISNLNQGRPVLYGGYKTIFQNGGHAFVCDGYTTGGNYFHFNFGWNDANGAYNDNWLTLNYIVPHGTNSDYSSWQDAIFYIHPKNNQNYCNFELSLLDHYTNIYIQSLSYDGNNGFSVPQSVFDAIPYNIPKYATKLTSAYPGTNIPSSWYTISAGTTREYVAHESITLKPGFHAKAGSNFRARIVPCNNCGSAAHAPSITKSIDATTEDLEFLEQYLSDNPIEFKTTNEIQVFPNPTTGKVYILTNAEKVSRIEIKNIQGITILQSNDVPQTEIMLDISVQPSGIYFLTVQTENGVQIFKILKN